MKDTLDHPLVRGDERRAKALRILRTVHPWPSAGALAKAVGWHKSTAADFISAARLEGETDGSQPSPDATVIYHRGDAKPTLQTDGKPTGRSLENKGPQGNETDSCNRRSPDGSPQSSNAPLTNPYKNTSPLSDYDSEPSSLRSLEPESPSGALRRAEQPRLDFNHAEERRADLLKALIFDHGVRLLTSTGMPDDSARSFLGKRIAEIGREPLAKAITTAIIDQVVEPRAYLAAVSPRSAEPARAAPTPATEPADYFEPWWNDPLPEEPLPGMPGYEAWCAEVAESERKRIEQGGGNGPH